MDKERLLELLKTDLKHLQDNAIIFSFEERTFEGQLSFLNKVFLALFCNLWTFIFKSILVLFCMFVSPECFRTVSPCPQ